jgi:hypothetical protein
MDIKQVILNKNQLFQPTLSNARAFWAQQISRGNVPKSFDISNFSREECAINGFKPSSEFWLVNKKLTANRSRLIPEARGIFDCLARKKVINGSRISNRKGQSNEPLPVTESEKRYFNRLMICSVIACTAASASESNPTVGSSFAGTWQLTPGRHSALSHNSHSFKP